MVNRLRKCGIRATTENLREWRTIVRMPDSRNSVRQLNDRKNRGKGSHDIYSSYGATKDQHVDDIIIKRTICLLHPLNFMTVYLTTKEETINTFEHKITDARRNDWDKQIRLNKLRTIVFYVQKRKYHPEIESKERIIITGTTGIGHTH